VLDRMRYRPAQWGTRAAWRTYAADGGERWMGFERVRELDGVSPDVVMVPLVGHTLGHAGIAIRRGGDDWLLYAGDAYFYRGEMDARPRCTPGLRAYQTLMEKDRGQRLANQARLRELIGAHVERGTAPVTVFCAHDVVEFERLAHRSAREPVGAARPMPGTAPPELPVAP
jgi:glyoxylase-like metal-dependent hydrolase (beta-lactamase superfamily II)